MTSQGYAKDTPLNFDILDDYDPITGHEKSTNDGYNTRKMWFMTKDDPPQYVA